jgi:hypothetical protein
MPDRIISSMGNVQRGDTSGIRHKLQFLTITKNKFIKFQRHPLKNHYKEVQGLGTTQQKLSLLNSRDIPLRTIIKKYFPHTSLQIAVNLYFSTEN